MSLSGPAPGSACRRCARAAARPTPRSSNGSNRRPLGRWAAGPLGRWASGPPGLRAAGPPGLRASGPSGLRAVQHIAKAAAGVDERRPEPVEVAPQVADVGFHDLRLAGIAQAPYVLQELGPGQHAALM